MMKHARAIVFVAALFALTAGFVVDWARTAPVMSGADLQARLDAMPSADGVGRHGSPEGGTYTVPATTIRPAYRIVLTKPLRVRTWQRLDLAGAVIEAQTLPSGRAAVEFDTGNPAHGMIYGGGVINGKIVSNQKGVGIAPTATADALFVTLRDVTIVSKDRAIDLVMNSPPGVNWQGMAYGCSIRDVWIPHPAVAPAVRLYGRINEIDGLVITNGPGWDTTPPLPIVDLKGTGTARRLWIETYRGDAPKPATALRVEGQWTVENAWLEMPDSTSPDVIAAGETVLRFTNSTAFNGIRAERGARVHVIGLRPEWFEARDYTTDGSAGAKVDFPESPTIANPN